MNTKLVATRLEWFRAGLGLLPETIKSDIISDTQFCRQNNLSTDGVLILFNGEITVKRSHLFQKIRKAYKNPKEIYAINDETDKTWALSNHNDEGKTYIKIENGGRSFILDSFWALTPNIEDRIKKFKKEAKLRLLSELDIAYWTEILNKESLIDFDITEMEKDLMNTPISIAENLMIEMQSGQSTVESLVPQNLRYYERLIGVHSNSKHIHDYSKNELKQHIDELFLNNYNPALKLTLMVCSHSSISRGLTKIAHNGKELLKIYDWVLVNGDPISKVAAIELGIFLLEKYPDIEPKLEELINDVFSENVKAQETQYKLLSSLIILVDGELSRIKLFDGKPVYYRRMASIAHASLIFRCIKANRIKFDEFSENILALRQINYYLQSLMDMRENPRWHPEYLEQGQLKNEMLGRVTNAFDIKNWKAQNSCYETLKKYSELVKVDIGPDIFLLGPLEGNLEAPKLPDNINKIIEDSLATEISSPKSFLPLMNSVLFCQIELKHIFKLLDIIKESKHILVDTENANIVLYVLDGLAKVAAMTRNTELSEEIIVLCRRYRNYLNVSEYPEHILATCLTSAAAFEEDVKWLMYIGSCVNELAYLSLTKKGIRSLFDWINVLILIEPRLRCTCGKALKIIKFLNESKFC